MERLFHSMNDSEEGCTTDEEDDVYPNSTSSPRESFSKSSHSACATDPEWTTKLKGEMKNTFAHWQHEVDFSHQPLPDLSAMYFLHISTTTESKERIDTNRLATKINSTKDISAKNETMFRMKGIQICNKNDPLQDNCKPQRVSITWNVYGYLPRCRILLLPVQNTHPEISNDALSEDFMGFLRTSIISGKLNLQNLATKSNETLGDLAMAIKEVTVLPNDKIDTTLDMSPSYCRLPLQTCCRLLEIKAESCSLIKAIGRSINEQNGMLQWKTWKVIPYEYNISHSRKFLMDCGIRPCSWVYTLGYLDPTTTSTEYGRFNFWMHYRTVKPRSIADRQFENTYSGEPLILRVLGFDVECKNNTTHRKFGLQKAGTHKNYKVHDRVSRFYEKMSTIFQIGIVVADVKFGFKDTPVIIRQQSVLLTLGRCGLGIAGITIFQFFDEVSKFMEHDNVDAEEFFMISCFLHIMTILEPDVITGYNISNFDLPLLQTRYETLYKRLNFSSCNRPCALHWSEMKPWTIRQHMGPRYIDVDRDLYARSKNAVILDSHILLLKFGRNAGSLSLTQVSSRNLPVHLHKYAMDNIDKVEMYMFKSDDSRKQLGKYCVKDAEIALNLLMFSPLKDLFGDISLLQLTITRSFEKNLLLQHVGNKSLDYEDWCRHYMFLKRLEQSHHADQN